MAMRGVRRAHGVGGHVSAAIIELYRRWRHKYREIITHRNRVAWAHHGGRQYQRKAIVSGKIMAWRRINGGGDAQRAARWRGRRRRGSVRVIGVSGAACASGENSGTSRARRSQRK